MSQHLPCADCKRPKNDPIHHDSPGDHWGAALHWYVEPAPPPAPQPRPTPDAPKHTGEHWEHANGIIAKAGNPCPACLFREDEKEVCECGASESNPVHQLEHRFTEVGDAPVPTERAWLLEKGTNDGLPEWIGVIDGSLRWTTDSLKALRLARREDADALAEIVDDAWKVTEHEWVPGGPNCKPDAPVAQPAEYTREEFERDRFGTAAPAAPSPAPSKAEHGLSKVWRSSTDTWYNCKCGEICTMESFNAHLRAEVRRETMEEVAEKWDIILHDEESDDDEHVEDFSGWLETRLRSEIGK